MAVSHSRALVTSGRGALDSLSAARCCVELFSSYERGYPSSAFPRRQFWSYEGAFQGGAVEKMIILN